MKTYTGMLSNGKAFSVKAKSMRQAVAKVTTPTVRVTFANGKA